VQSTLNPVRYEKSLLFTAKEGTIWLDKLELIAKEDGDPADSS